MPKVIMYEDADINSDTEMKITRNGNVFISVFGDGESACIELNIEDIKLLIEDLETLITG